jgi:hypothetical protein
MITASARPRATAAQAASHWWAASAQRQKLDPQRLGGRLVLAQLVQVSSRAAVIKHGDARDARHGLLEKGEPLGAEIRVDVGGARDVSAWPRQARDQPGADQVAGAADDDRDRAGRALERKGRGRALRDDDVGLRRHQLGGKGGKPGEIAVGMTIRDDDVLSFHISELAQPLPEHLGQPLRARVGGGVDPQHGDPIDLLRVFGGRAAAGRHYRGGCDDQDRESRSGHGSRSPGPHQSAGA